MKIEIIVPGKISKHLQSALDYYLERLQKYAKVSLSFVELGGDINTKEGKVIIRKEAEEIKKRLKGRKYILVDLHGSHFSSEEFAKKLDNILTVQSEIVFVIGGPLGIDDTLRTDALFKLSFSKMTFTHEMCVILLFEQIFRSFKILNNEKYHY